MSGKKYDGEKPPVVRGFLHYFPRSIKAISLASQYGLEKYDLEYEDRNFMSLDPGRLLDADGRHLLDEIIEGPYDSETGLLHAVHHAWEALARLEVLLEDGVPVRMPSVEEVDGPEPPLRAILPDLSDSMRTVNDVIDALLAGADGVTLYGRSLPLSTSGLPAVAEKGVGPARDNDQVEVLPGVLIDS